MAAARFSLRDPRLVAAVVAGRATAAVIRRLGRGGGTTLPGRIAEGIDRGALTKLSAGLTHGSILVTGTNGKTTTAALLRLMLRAAGFAVVANDAGSNLGWGLTSALLQDGRALSAGGHGRGAAGSVRRIGVFEVDEGTLPLVTEVIAPRLLVVTNLFRDQLDRYGELESTSSSVAAALAALPAGADALLCADDPGVATLGDGLRARVTFFGVDDVGVGTEGLPHAADAKFCARCGEPLDFARVFVGHMGHHSCPSGDAARPQPTVVATEVRLDGIDGQAIRASIPPGTTLELDVPLAGLYNTYNVLAAVGAATLVGVPASSIEAAVREFEPSFGRLQRLHADGRTLHVLLAKNPTGFNEVLSLVSGHLGAGSLEGNFLVAVNDRLADGRDVSWLWDVDFERLVEAAHVVLAGERALDMAIRLKYAGLPPERVRVAGAVADALDEALRATPLGGDLFILPTYTAMLEIHAELARRGLTRRFWESA